MSAGQFEAVRARVSAFRQELLDLIEDAPAETAGDDREVYVLGFQIVPVTQKPKG
jgi:hypothetical protein